MNIYVSVDNVEIKEHNKLHEGEYKINKCFFEFSEEYTQNLTSRAVFTTINGTYEETIINNQCDIPTEVLKEKGDVEIGVYSYEIDNEELKLRYSPGSTKFSVDNGSYKEANQTEAPTPSEFEKYLYSFNENAVNKTNEFNENANRKITELNKISTDISNMKNSVEKSEQNTKTSEDNAKASETSAQNSANKALESETNIVNIEKNINAIKEQIDTIKTNIDGQVNTVNALAENAATQATKAENQAKISTENAAATSADKTAVSEMKSELEEFKNEAKTSRDEAESFKNETLEAKEVVENSLENERIKSEKQYAKAVDTEVITVDEFAQVELDEDGYMEDVVVEASKEITQEVREGYNDLKYPYVNTTKTEKGITFTDNGNGSITINGTATENVEFSCQWENKVPNGSYSYITYGLPSNCYCNYYGVGNKYGEAVGNYNTDETEGNITLEMSIHIPSGVTVNNVTVYPMLVKGQYTKETIPAWEQYGVSPSLNYPSEFENMVKEVDIQNNSITNKIALSEGQFLGNFKGYSNAIDKGVLKGQLKEVVLTGNESIYNSSNGNIFRISLDTPHLENTSTQVKTDLVKSNYFNNVSYAELNDASVDNGIEIYNNYIQFRDSQIASVEEWKAKLKELYDAGTPVKILYVAQTEEQQELSQENLQVINSLQIYQGENNVSTPEAKLSFKANQGIPSYVDKVVDEKLVENNLSEREISDNKYPKALKKKVSETDFTQVFAENEKIEGLKIYGAELTQETREGYNKLDIKTLNYVMNITIVEHTYEALTVEMTDMNEKANFRLNPVELKAGVIYKIQRDYEVLTGTKQNDTGALEIFFGTTWKKVILGSSQKQGTFTVDEDGTYYIMFKIAETNVSNFIEKIKIKFSNIMLYDYTSQTDKPYEQYGAMPSLDYPSEVHTMNDRVNLFDKDNVNVINGYINKTNGRVENSSVSKSLYIACLPNETYTISKVASYRFSVATTNELPTNGVSCYNIKENHSGTEITTTADENSKYLVVFFYNANQDTTITEQEILDSIKIEKNKKASPYSPHRQGSLEVENVNENLANFPTSINGTISGTNFAGIKYEVINRFTSKISGKPTSPEYRVGGVYNSTDVLVPIDYTKNVYISNNLKLSMEITLVQKDGTYRQVYLKSGNVIPLKETDIGISSLKFEIDTNTEYKNTILRYFIYEEKNEVIIPFPQDTFTGAIGSYKDTIKEVDGRWKVEKRIFKYTFTGKENFAKMNPYATNHVNTILIRTNISNLNLDKATQMLSNYFKYDSRLWFDDKEAIGNTEPNSIEISFSKDRYSNDSDINTIISNFKTYLSTLYDEGRPLEVCYISNTPKYIDLLDETQEILNGIELRLGLNNFSIDVGTFSYIYNKSLEKELEEKDQLIEELASRILALENAAINQ